MISIITVHTSGIHKGHYAERLPSTKKQSSSQQPTLSKEDEQSSILRLVELHYNQLGMR